MFLKIKKDKSPIHAPFRNLFGRRRRKKPYRPSFYVVAGDNCRVRRQNRLFPVTMDKNDCPTAAVAMHAHLARKHEFDILFQSGRMLRTVFLQRTCFSSFASKQDFFPSPALKAWVRKPLLFSVFKSGAQKQTNKQKDHHSVLLNKQCLEKIQSSNNGLACCPISWNDFFCLKSAADEYR